MGWYRPEGQCCHLCPLNKLWLSIIPVSRACVQKGKCLQYEGASVSPSVARGGFRGNFERSSIWLGAQDVGGAQQTLLLFSLFIFFPPQLFQLCLMGHCHCSAPFDIFQLKKYLQRIRGCVQDLPSCSVVRTAKDRNDGR